MTPPFSQSRIQNLNNPMTVFQRISDTIAKAAHTAGLATKNPEAKLRELVSPIFREYLATNQLDLNFEQRDELFLANGRADSVYNRLILEYKKPGEIKADNLKNRKIISQVQGYVEDLAQKEGWKKERLLGVAFDGRKFLFIRKARRWVYQDPVDVSPDSVEFFFQNLAKLTGGNPLLPEYLIKDFAVGGDADSVAARAIKSFYLALTANVDPKVKVFFNQWAVQFAEVHGTIENKRFDSKTLFRSYGFSKEETFQFNYLAFFFALDSYYSVFMKLLAFQVVGYYTMGKLIGLPLADWEELDSTSLQGKLAQLESGGIFKSLGVDNFLEGDLLSWYLNDWNDAIETSVRLIIKRLNRYDPQTMELLPDETRDILKKLYQFLVPRSIRHDLGEYYTPDWLAERCLNQVGYGVDDRGLLQKRLLDPGCGSGTFLVLAIKRIKEHARKRDIQPGEALELITRNVVGFDLNPLAVTSAKTNYLLAIAELLKYKKGEITIPVYLCDSINPPKAKQEGGLFDVAGGHFQISTTVGQFRFPEQLVKRAAVQKTATLLENGVRKKSTTKDFLIQLHNDLGIENNLEFDSTIAETYDKLVQLDKKGINGIWARIIKNAFAPLFVGRFDFVVGNPPWVNWESLPKEYREELLPLNHDKYKLFPHKGLSARLGSSKIDLSSLMLYVSADNYLADKGKLCFVITQTLFQSVGSKGFRKFYIDPINVPLKVVQVDDMVKLNPFEGATNRTAVLFLIKGERTNYPVEYVVWKKEQRGPIPTDLSLEEVTIITNRTVLRAYPINSSDYQSNWITAKTKSKAVFDKLHGESYYKAHKGVDCSANGVFWLTVVARKQKIAEIRNFIKGAKRVIPEVTADVESSLLFPLMRGKDVKRWLPSSSLFILIPQDINKRQNGMHLTSMRREYPLAYTYLARFEKELSERKTYQKFLKPQGLPFYSLYDIKNYTFTPFKVVWKEISTRLEAAVIGSDSGKVVVPDHKLVFVAFQDENEAHFFCAVINSSIVAAYVSASAISTQNAPKILMELRIPQFDQQNTGHLELSRLSRLCHEKAQIGVPLDDVEEQIDFLVCEIWGITSEELKQITSK